MAPPFIPLEVRFWSKVAKGGPDDCWLWQGAYTNGYGILRLPGKRGGNEGAHRIAWLLAHGEVPAGKHVLHHCDVRGCVNVRHLFVGDNSDNVADKVSKGRSLTGERNPSAKLTEQDVEAIRVAYAGGVSMYRLALTHGVSRKAVSNIIHGRTWKHFGVRQGSGY